MLAGFVNAREWDAVVGGVSADFVALRGVG
jgi:hypothetical protein